MVIRVGPVADGVCNGRTCCLGDLFCYPGHHKGVFTKRTGGAMVLGGAKRDKDQVVFSVSLPRPSWSWFEDRSCRLVPVATIRWQFPFSHFYLLFSVSRKSLVASRNNAFISFSPFALPLTFIIYGDLPTAANRSRQTSEPHLRC